MDGPVFRIAISGGLDPSRPRAYVEIPMSSIEERTNLACEMLDAAEIDAVSSAYLAPDAQIYAKVYTADACYTVGPA